MRYDIYNPTKAGRVIYDGIGSEQRKITVLPGETKCCVELADHIAAGFNFAPCEDKSDLVLTALDQKPEWTGIGDPKVLARQLPPDYVRYQAPPLGEVIGRAEPVFVTNTPRAGESAEQTAARYNRTPLETVPNSPLDLYAAAEPPKRRRRRKVQAAPIGE